MSEEVFLVPAYSCRRCGFHSCSQLEALEHLKEHFDELIETMQARVEFPK